MWHYRIAYRIAVDIEQLRYDSSTKDFRSLYDLIDRNFNKYGDLYIRDSKRQFLKDIKKDLKLEGTKQLVIKDDSKIVGHIKGSVDDISYYGNFILVDDITIDDWVKDYYNIDTYKKCLSQNREWAFFISDILEKRVYCISELAIDKAYRAYFLSLAGPMRDHIRSHGYKYLTFLAMADTQHLMLDKSGHLKNIIARKFGLSEYHIDREDPDFNTIILKII